MKILWIVNTIFPIPSEYLGIKSSVFGGWLNSMFNVLKASEEINSIVIATTYKGNKLHKIDDGKVVYYLLPCNNNTKYDRKIVKIWKEIVTNESPDLVHIHGTEFAHSNSYFKAVSNVKTIVSIQGLISVIGKSKNYNANISWFQMIKNITLRDILKRDLLIFQAYKFRKRGIYEKEVLKKADAIVGRTDWDYINSSIITGEDKYFLCNENLRNDFYNKTWDINNIDKHTIFISQASYPIKGFHIFLEALNLIKSKYPDVHVYVAGNNIIPKNIGQKFKQTGYSKYISNIIKKYNLDKHITFTGMLNSQEMVKLMLKCHTFVQASTIENSSNSLGEAMIIGMPCVVSNVGGTNSMILDKIEGLLYPSNDESLLAYYVMKCFQDSELCENIGKNAQLHAKKTHNCENNLNNLLEIYRNIINR